MSRTIRVKDNGCRCALDASREGSTPSTLTNKYTMRWEEIFGSDELVEAPIGPTAVFIPVHGNYCGPGNRGGAPIDDLDKACFKHDCEYDRSYKEQDPNKTERQIEADRHFVRRVLKVAQDPSKPKMVRLKVYAAAKYFSRRISKFSRH